MGAQGRGEGGKGEQGPARDVLLSAFRTPASGWPPSYASPLPLHSLQVLSPSQVSRARLFGSRLSLGEQWVRVDDPYFDAPGGFVMRNWCFDGSHGSAFTIYTSALQVTLYNSNLIPTCSIRAPIIGVVITGRPPGHWLPTLMHLI